MVTLVHKDIMMQAQQIVDKLLTVAEQRCIVHQCSRLKSVLSGPTQVS